METSRCSSLIHLSVIPLLLIALSSAGKADTAPSITSLVPAAGPVGRNVTITGTNFGATQGASTVTLNGTPAATVNWTATRIVVLVPSGVSMGNSNMVVTVGGLASNAVNFTMVPRITGLSPLSGPVGTLVTFTGTTFGATQGTNTVTFSGTVATPTSWSDTPHRSSGPHRGRRGLGGTWVDDWRLWDRLGLPGDGDIAASHHRPGAGLRAARNAGDNHGNELRRHPGDEHGDIQRDAHSRLTSWSATSPLHGRVRCDGKRALERAERTTSDRHRRWWSDRAIWNHLRSERERDGADGELADESAKGGTVTGGRIGSSEGVDLDQHGRRLRGSGWYKSRRNLDCQSSGLERKRRSKINKNSRKVFGTSSTVQTAGPCSVTRRVSDPSPWTLCGNCSRRTSSTILRERRWLIGRSTISLGMCITSKLFLKVHTSQH